MRLTAGTCANWQSPVIRVWVEGLRFRGFGVLGFGGLRFRGLGFRIPTECQRKVNTPKKSW